MIYFYRLLWLLFSPFFAVLFIIRICRGKEDITRLKERFGCASAPRPLGQLIWFHCASVGESLSIQPLLHKILADKPNVNILITTGTVTSAKLMEKRLPKGCIHQFIPLDTYPTMKAFTKHWQPDVSVLVESEFWPELMTQAPHLMLINARMSDRSAKRYNKLKCITQGLLKNIQIAYAQSPIDAERMAEAGVTPVYNTGNLKFDVAIPTIEDAVQKTFTEAIRNRPVLVAASTHPTEEALFARVHQALKAELPNLLTIIAPRHPHRGDAIMKELQSTGLSLQLRGEARTPLAPDTDIYIANTIGEMNLWYSLADIVVMGGSFIKHGGQNPYEPLKQGRVTLCGPHMFNFRHMMQTFKEREIILQVPDEKKLTSDILYFMKNAKERKKAEVEILNRMNDLGGATNKTAYHILERLL